MTFAPALKSTLMIPCFGFPSSEIGGSSLGRWCMFVYLQWETSFETIKKCCFFSCFFHCFAPVCVIYYLPKFFNGMEPSQKSMDFPSSEGGGTYLLSVGSPCLQLFGSGRSPRKATPRRSWSHVRNQRPWSWLQDDLRLEVSQFLMDGWMVMILPKRNQWMDLDMLRLLGGCITIDWKNNDI